MQALLIIFDRLPYGLLGCCGNTETNTPGFDQLAAEGITFDLCFATETTPVETVSELAAALTVLESAGVIVRTVRQQGSICGESLTTATTAEGVKSAAISDGTTPLADRVGSVLQSFLDQGPGEMPALTVLSLRGVSVDKLDEGGSPASSLVSEADAVIARILDLVPPGSAHCQLLLVTAAQGIPQIGSKVDGETAIETVDSLVHVPLLVRVRPSPEEGVRSSAFVTVADVSTTLLDWFNQPAAEPGDLCSLFPVIDGNASNAREVVLVRGAGGEVGLRTSDWYLLTRLDLEQPVVLQRTDAIEAARLFRKPEDLWDVLDVSTQSPEVVEQLVDRLVVALAPREM